MSDPRELNRRKQEFLRLNGINVKVDGSWGPWLETQYRKLTTKDKHYQTTPLGALSYLYDKTFGNTTYLEDPDYVKGYSGELTEDTRSDARRWVDHLMQDNKTPLGYVTLTVAPAAATAAALVYGTPVVVNGVTKGAPLLYNGVRTAVTNPSTIMPAIKTGANAGLLLGKTFGKEALKAGVGMAAVNGASKVTTGKTWGENMAQSTGMSLELGELTNPGAYGPTYLKNVAKRGIETAMRTTANSNPIDDILRGLSHILKKDKKRALSIGNYILTGTRIGNKGYYNSLALDPQKYYSGILGKDSSLPANDMIDAFLYKKPIDTRYGVTRVNNKDYGVHSQYIKDNYPNKDVAIYEVVPPKYGPKLYEGSPTNYKSNIIGKEDFGMDFNSSSNNAIDVGGYLMETAVNEAREPIAYRLLDIWKFNPKDYSDRWIRDNSYLILNGLKLVDHLGNPVITRTRWFKPEID